MANHIEGPLYYERMGRKGPVMAFVHPNPMDQSCWLYQMAHFSTWYRCMAIDIPGYGRSPQAREGLTMADMADACWEAIDDAFPGGEPAILVGCSVGANIVPYMHHHAPTRTRALVLCGTSYSPDKAFAHHRIKAYGEHGIGYRWGYAFEDFSPAFRATPLARWFADLFAERNPTAHVQSILHQFKALSQPDAADHHARIACPTLIVSGSEDKAHPGAWPLKQRIRDCEMQIIYGAGHACQIEQPWLFDEHVIDFLKRRGLHPE